MLGWLLAMLGALHDAFWTSFLSLRLGPVEEAGTRGDFLLHVTESQDSQDQKQKANWSSVVVAKAELPPKRPGTVRLVLVSDTHERHAGIQLPPCDAVLHSGDVLASSRWAPQVHAEEVLKDLGRWLRSVNCSARFVIAGNHDYWIEHLGSEAVQALLGEGVHYLEFSAGSFPVSLGPSAESTVDVTVFGAPISAGRSPNRAFQHQEALRRLDDSLPESSDILLTHGPLLSAPKKELPAVAQVLKRLKPALHVCGHVHGRYGSIAKMEDHALEPGMSINASIMHSLGKLRGQRPLNAPIVVDLALPDRMPKPKPTANSTCTSGVSP